jgi:hypothetical protein
MLHSLNSSLARDASSDVIRRLHLKGGTIRGHGPLDNPYLAMHQLLLDISVYSLVVFRGLALKNQP